MTRIDIVDVVIKELNGILIEKLSVQYCNVEKLAFNLIQVANSSDCIERLALNIIHKHAEIPQTKEIKNLIKTQINKIKSLDITAYYRTKKVQELIHNIVQDTYGKNSHLLLPSDAMRKTLSVSRLHFFIDDLNNKKLEDIELLIDKSEKEVEVEFENNTDNRVSGNKKYIHNWNLRHKKSFTIFTDYSSISDVRGDIYGFYKESLGTKYKIGYAKNMFNCPNFDIQKAYLEQPALCENILNVISSYYISVCKQLRE